VERSGSAPAGGVTAPDLAALALGPGPFVSVVLTTDPAIENAAHQTATHWKARREHLEQQGAPPGALQAIDETVPDAHLHGASLLAAAGADGSIVFEHGDELPDNDLATLDELPRLAPIVKHRQAAIPFVLALVDRRGVDLVAVSAHRSPTEAHAGTHLVHEHKTRSGGWSQLRHQHHVEHEWERGAKEVTDVIVDRATLVGARLLLLAGDERILSMIQDDLPTTLEHEVRVLDGGRARDGSAAITEAEARRFIADLSARDTVATLEKLREELGQHDRAVEGLSPTLDALARAQVDELLVADVDGGDGWFGDDAVPVAASADALTGLGIAAPRSARAIDVAVRAALGTGARVRVVPHSGGPRDGLGALLRWS
jgi:hypothetical protein